MPNINSVLAGIALILAVASFVVAGPLVAIAVVLLAVALLIPGD